MKHSPLPFQASALEKISSFGGKCLLAMEMGLGKSPTALRWTNGAGAYPMLVVCPAGLKGNWEAETWKFLGKRVTILNGEKPPPKLKLSTKIAICNYDILQYWWQTLAKCGFSTLVLDEAHRIKNRRAKCSKAARKLSRGIPNRLALTGTPITNRHAELWQILNVIDPKRWPSFFAYAMNYSQPRKRPWGWDYSGSTNSKGLFKELSESCMIRIRKADVLTDLPPKMRSIVRMSLTEQAQKEYNKAFSRFLSWLHVHEGHGAAKKALRAKQLAKTNYMRKLAAKLKMKSVLEWVDNFLESSDGKICLFAYHKSILNQLEERYHKVSVRIDGDTKKELRKGIVDDFNSSKKLRIFLGQTHAAGIGLNITGAHSVAFVELVWTPSDHTQAEDRAYGRLSDLHGADCYYLVADGTIETNIVKLLNKKQKISDAAIDGASVEASESVFNELLVQLEEQAKGAY